MKNNLILGRRVFQNSLVIATTFVTCAALQADDPSASAQVDINTPSSAQGAGQSSQKGQSNQQVEKFVQKAMASGKMEVQMGQLGQTQAQKHQQHLGKLKQQTGAEFDKEFVRMALKHHKKDIQEFEKAQTQLNDSELKSFVSETLPKLRQHQQMAQAAAKAVGVDAASITADIDVDTDSSAVGGAAQAESGPREKSPILQRESSTPQSTDRPRSSIDGATETDASGTINQNNPSISADAQIGDRDLSADADVDVDADDAAIEADVDTDSDNQVFEKGDGKVLGLSTDKNDGKFLGIIPNPRKDKDADADASIEADADVDVDDASVGGSASVESGSKSDK